MSVDRENLNLEYFEQLFKMYFKALKTYSVRYVYDEYVAEDIVQDTFFELWKRRDEIEFDEYIKSYLFKSVYNKSLNYLRNNKLKTISSIASADDAIFLDSYLQTMQSSQEENLIVKEILREITAVIDQLPPQCKKVFILSRRYEFKNREIAEQLDISLKSVEKHITKALSQIRDHLKKMKLLILFLIIHLFG
jgi:RNA polymerase sigma-70 factor (ECF subfamily)